MKYILIDFASGGGGGDALATFLARPSMRERYV